MFCHVRSSELGNRSRTVGLVAEQVKAVWAAVNGKNIYSHTLQ